MGRASEFDGRAIAIGRAMKGLTQGELAHLAGVPVWRLWSFESSLMVPTQKEWVGIIKALSTEERR